MKSTEIKAKELVDMYFEVIPTPCMDTYDNIFKIHKERAIQCAIICVDEILKLSCVNNENGYTSRNTEFFWQEVLTILKAM